MSVQAARLIVRDWNGTYRHERHLDHVNPAMQMNVPGSGFEASRTGWGDCLELTFDAIWSTLGAEERDILELDVLDGGVETREFAGVVLKSGNSQTWRHSGFKAVGLKKRLQEVRTWLLTLPEQDAGASVRQLMQAVIGSADLGGAILYDAALIPDMAHIVGTFRVRGRKVSDVLDYLAAEAGAAWGVNADRKLFLVKISTAQTVTLTEGAGLDLTFEDTDSEAMVTQVLYTLGQRPDGSLLQTVVTIPEAASLGAACKDVTLDETVPAWETAPMTAALTNATAQYADQGYLSDGLGFETVPAGVPVIYSLTDAGANGSVEYAVPAHLRVQIDLLYILSGAGQGHLEVKSGPAAGGAIVDLPGGFYRDQAGQGVYRMTYSPPENLLTFPTLYYRLTIPAGQILQVYEFRPERPRAELLNSLTAFHAVLPNRDPATVTASGRVTPRPKLAVVKEVGGTYLNTAERYTLHVKLGVELQTVIQAGQRESAEERAARWLGQLALQDATLDSVRFGRGS